MGPLCAEQDVGNLKQHALSGIMGLLCVEQNVGNLNKMHFQKLWGFCAQNKKSEMSTNALSEFLGLVCAGQNVGNVNKCTFRNYGTLARSKQRRKSSKIEDPGFCELLLVAPDGPTSSTIEDLGFLSLS